MAVLIKKAVSGPVNRGVVRVPVVMQMETSECGAAALVMIMHYYRKWITLAEARADCGVSTEGVNAGNMLKAARSYGMDARAWSVEPEPLLKEGPFPCILHWGFNHFVVLCGFKGRRAVINDPARGRVRVEWEEFDRMYTGVCLTIEPGEDFIPSGKCRSVLSYAGEHLSGFRPAVAFLAIATAASSVLVFVQPVFSRVFLDRLLTGQNPEWLMPFLTLFLLFTLMSIAVCWITTVYSLRIQGAIAVRSGAAFLWKVLHLPLKFFDRRLSADIAERQASGAAVSDALVKTLAPLIVQLAMMVFYLAVMIRFSPLLSLIGVGGILINFVVSCAVTTRSVNITRARQHDASKLYAATISGIEMIEVIKAGGAENGFFGRWAGYQARVSNRSVQYARLNHVLGSVPQLIAAVSNVAVLGVGVLLVLRSQFTVGMVMAFQGFLSAFANPSLSIISAGRSMQEMTGQMERQHDVLSYEEDPMFATGEKSGGKERLSGAIELKGVTFGYSGSAEPILRNISMTVKPGQKIGIVGRTGCGKTTLAGLISGIYRPWSGCITFDGRPIEDIDRDVFVRSVGVVDQNTVLFEDTVAGNITLWNPEISGSEIRRSAEDACILDAIESREGGFERVLQSDGAEYSCGQRKCLEIARVLSGEPDICILDEATEALDLRSERKILDAIRSRGITCIVIAHRFSAIRDCDEIIVLDEGQIVERGTHETLLDRGGVYAALAGDE